MKKKFDLSLVWAIICIGWLILAYISSVRGMDTRANWCLIYTVLFYLFFLSDCVRNRLDDIETKIDGLESDKPDEKKADDEPS